MRRILRLLRPLLLWIVLARRAVCGRAWFRRPAFALLGAIRLWPLFAWCPLVGRGGAVGTTLLAAARGSLLLFELLNLALHEPA